MSALNHNELSSVEDLSAAELSQVVGGGLFKKVVKSVVTHTAKGASKGSAFGPYGAFAGGFIGFGQGLYKAHKENPERKNRRTNGKR